MSRIRWGVVVSCLMMFVSVVPAQAAESGFRIKRLTNETSYVQSRVGEQFFAAQLTSATQLKLVLAHDKVDGPRETVQSMCQRYNCLVGINGDFFGGPTRHGGIVIGNHVLRTGYRETSQLWLAKKPRLQAGWLKGDVTVTAARQYQLPLNQATNLGLGSVYTSAFGGVLKTQPGGMTVVYTCGCRTRPDAAGKSYALRQVGVIRDAREIKLGIDQVAIRLMPNQVRSVGGGLRKRIKLSLPTTIRNSVNALGAHPILVTAGKINPYLTNEFSTSLHPRSMFAYNGAGKVWLIAIDTRVTLVKAAQIAVRLGATEAINLDGGGSTTFVVHGRTVNEPADKAEREVASALIVVNTATKVIKQATKPKTKSSPIPAPRPKPKAKPVVIRESIIRAPMVARPRPVELALPMTAVRSSIAAPSVLGASMIGSMMLLLRLSRRRH